MNLIPDKSLGGTFHYAADGSFLHHEPATRPAPPIEIPPPASFTKDPGVGLSPDPGLPIDPPPAQPAAKPRTKKE